MYCQNPPTIRSPTLDVFKSVASNYHTKLKFLTTDGVRDVIGDNKKKKKKENQL